MSLIYIAGQEKDQGLTQAEPSIDYPRPDRLVSGNPQRITHSEPYRVCRRLFYLS